MRCARCNALQSFPDWQPHGRHWAFQCHLCGQLYVTKIERPTRLGKAVWWVRWWLARLWGRGAE